MKEQQAGSRRANALRRGKGVRGSDRGALRGRRRCRVQPATVCGVTSSGRARCRERNRGSSRSRPPRVRRRIGTELETVETDPMGRSAMLGCDRGHSAGGVRVRDRSGTRDEEGRARRLDRGSPIRAVAGRHRLSDRRHGSGHEGPSALPGMLRMLRVPVLRSVGLKASTAIARRGVRNLARLAEQRASRT